MKKSVIISLLILIAIVIAGFFIQINGESLNVLVVYDKDSQNYLDAYENYSQSLITNLKASSKSIQEIKGMNLSNYQVIYLDKSILNKTEFEDNKQKLIDYVSDGGNLFLENEFYQSFPKEFIGASEFKAVNGFPTKIEYPEVRLNLKGLQDTVRDFYTDYSTFSNKQEIMDKAYGFGVIPSTAKTLISNEGISLYTVNQVGKGFALFANPLLPSDSYITGFDLKAKDVTQDHFNSTVATANYLFRNEFAAFAAKEKTGYVLKKVLGTYGRPAMAWQNHFEVLSAIKNESMQKWTEFLKPYNQIPSFSLVRAFYDWGVWKESIIYHLNVGSDKTPAFVGEEENSQYSSGRQAMVGDDYLVLQPYPDYKSLASPIELPYRAFPSVYDMDGDGIKDIVSGSFDGAIYFYKGKKSENSWDFEKATKLKLENGTFINLGSYSAPVLYDMNKDGKMDLIVGNGDGELLLLINKGNQMFGNPQTLVKNKKDIKIISPEIIDLDADGTDDLVCGDEKGNLYFYKGKTVNGRVSFGEGVILKDSNGNVINAGTFASPRGFDYDGDGKLELVVGNGDGYLKRYKNQFPTILDDGYMDGQTLNPSGTKHLWSGHNVVPFFADINNDGKQDLIVGQLEFGMAIPIDAAGFPYKKELKNALDYLDKNFVTLEPHVFVHSYKSPEQEQKEIELQKKSFEFYGLTWEGQGTNQHTWRINNLDPLQTFRSEFKQGLMWNSGFRPSNNIAEPFWEPEYSLNMPFRIAGDKDLSDMIVLNSAPSVNLAYAYTGIARWDIPVSYFYHIEYDILKEDSKKNLANTAEFLDSFRNENDYNFMSETQMFTSMQSVLNTDVNVRSNLFTKIFYFIQNKLRTKQQFAISVNYKSNKTIRDLGEYSDITGLKLELGEKYSNCPVQTDSDIYLRKSSNLYFALNKTVKLYSQQKTDSSHIVRANLPVEITKDNGQVKIKIKDKGFQQIKVYAPNGMDVLSDGWESKNEKNEYTLSRFGDVTELLIKLK